MIIAPQKRKRFTSWKSKILALGVSCLIGYGSYSIIDNFNKADDLEISKSEVDDMPDLGDDWYNYANVNFNNTGPDSSCIIGDNLARNSDANNLFNYWNLTEFINYRNMTLPHRDYGNVSYLVYDSLCDERDAFYLPGSNKTRVMEDLKNGNFTYSFGMEVNEDSEMLEKGEFVAGGFRFFPYENGKGITGMNITKAVVVSSTAYEDGLLGELIIQSANLTRRINNTLADFRRGHSVKDVNLFLKPGFFNVTLNHGLIGRLELDNIAIGEDFPRSGVYSDEFILSGESLRRFLKEL